MSGKPKHSYVLRQKPSTTWEILAKNSEGKEFYYGDFSLKQNAVRWGDSHKNPTKFPQVVERDFIEDLFSEGLPNQPVGFNPKFYSLCEMAGVNPQSPDEVSAFTGLPKESLSQFPIPDTPDNLIWQPNGSV
jgi:hypothetical protein